MFKEHKKALIISSILILLPILAGLLLWEQLPDPMVTHWGTDGEANGWSSKAFSVFGLPGLIFLLHWVCILVTSSDTSNQKQSKKAITLVLWICPVISVLGCASVYCTALGMELNMVTLPYLLMALMFILIGNYLPKCKHNYTIGIKLPWTLKSEENWNATHRLAGKVWVIGGILFLPMVFLPQAWRFPVLFAVLLTLVLIPTIYSYLYAKKHP